MLRTVAIFSICIVSVSLAATTAHGMGCGGKVQGLVILTDDLSCQRSHGLSVDTNAILDCAGRSSVQVLVVHDR